MTASLDPDARTAPSPDAENRTSPVRQWITRNRRLARAVLLVVLVSTSVAFLWVREGDIAPADRAAIFVSDMVNGRSDEALLHICASGARHYRSGERLEGWFKAALRGRLAAARVGDQLIPSGPDRTKVNVPFTGVMADGSSTRFEVRLVREEGRWRVCGAFR